jgi:hypothetical protein
VGAALEQPVSLERDEVVMDGARGGEPDVVRDLTDRGRVPTLLDGAGDAVEDSLTTLDVVPGHVGFPPV